MAVRRLSTLVRLRPTAHPAAQWSRQQLRAFSSPPLEDDFDIDSLGLEEEDRGTLAEQDLDLGLKTTSTNVDTFGGLLDPNAPPRLRNEHYELLKGIDFTGRRARREAQRKPSEEEWAKRVANVRELTKKQFGFDPQALMQIQSFEPRPEVKPSVFVEQRDPLAEFQQEVTFEKEALPREDPVYGLDPKMTGKMWVEPEALSLLDRQAPLKFDFRKKGTCIFCLPDPSKNQIKEITYTNIQLLHRFINERGMIKPRKLTFTCAKHQRKLAVAIKRARIIGLLNFTDNFHVPYSFANMEEDGNMSRDVVYDPNEATRSPSNQSRPKQEAQQDGP